MTGRRWLFGATGDRCVFRPGVTLRRCGGETTNRYGQDMEVADALRTLGVEPGASWEDIRQAYRDGLMRHHPDAGGGEGSAERTDAIVSAFRSLRTITNDGVTPLPLPLVLDIEDPTAPMVLHARPGDVFVRLCQAAEQIGHLSYADRDANLLQVMIGDVDAEWAPSQLTAELTAEGSLTMAMFSLEPIGVSAAPPIADVVARLAEELRAPAALD